jgi:hypothetical protein
MFSVPLLLCAAATAAAAPKQACALKPRHHHPGVCAAMRGQDALVDHLKRDGVVTSPEGALPVCSLSGLVICGPCQHA